MVISFIREIIKRWNWSKSTDRIGPDIIYSQILSYAPNLYNQYCKKKLKSLGENSEIRPGAIIVCCSNINIGDNVVIRPNSVLIGNLDVEISIEDNVLLGSGVHLYVSNHEFKDSSIPIYYQGHQEPKAIKIKEGSWIGANAIILPGVTVGKNSVVAAGAVVTKDVPDFSVVAGVPAKLIKKLV
ncbi:acyltransferase [Ureibacillus sinduriensis]|uniref:acyltransferase n=1 Tax=Ureibacillus sinduriensis TaxID=561440 RepID=UPI000A448D81|nr:DapH/DapD/GlmU-related protein [Ureibacillus sinduriensis]